MWIKRRTKYNESILRFERKVISCSQVRWVLPGAVVVEGELY